MNQIHLCNIIISEIHNYVKKNIQTYVIHTGLYTYHGGADDDMDEQSETGLFSAFSAALISSNGMFSFETGFLPVLRISV